MKKCFIFNTEPEYVRTKNFINSTKEIFEPVIVDYDKGEDKTDKVYLDLPSIPVIRQISKIKRLFSLWKNGIFKDWAYIPNFDPISIKISHMLGIKVITDILEPYPEMQNSKILSALYRSFEKEALNKSDILITVTEEEKANLKNRYGERGVITIRNFPDLNDFKPTKTKFKDFSIVYFGVCMPSRDLTNATKAIAKLQKEHNLSFHVIGDKNLVYQTFCKYKYHGWLNHKKSSDIISRCHIGLSPYQNTPHCNLTLQNKAFQYAACNILPLSTNLMPLHKYCQLVKLSNNSVESWYNEIKKYFLIWKTKKLKFNQRAILKRNKWDADSEWKKLNKLLRKNIEGP